MSVIVKNTTESIKYLIENAAKKAIFEGLLQSAELTPFAVEVPADRSHGDFAVNAAMVWSRVFRTNPRAIAEAIVSNLELEGTYIDRAEIAGPGFINLFLSDNYYADIVSDVIAKGADYGCSEIGKGKKIMVEFVSANPTGPMHVGNARGGALGDCIAAVLEKAGYDTFREFYINDAGNQIAKFGLSLDIRYKQLFDETVEMPEEAYHGQDIIDHAKNFAAIHGDKYLKVTEEERRDALVKFALPQNIEGLERDLKKYRIVYDNWFV